MTDSARAVSLGLIVTELLINAIKYAFPAGGTHDTVKVSYDISGPDWKLTVADNGIGKTLDEAAPPASGLGTAIVRALVRQLDAQLSITSLPESGLSVAISRATFQRRLRHA